MKAIILAAGYSTRLRPLTDYTAKPLLQIGSGTILDMILKNVLELADLDQTLVVVVAAGAQAGPVALVAARGVQVSVQVNDTQGVLASSGKGDDILVGVKGTSAASPFLVAGVVSKNAGGKTVSLVVPPSQAVNLLVYSRVYQLGDTQGHSYATPSAQTSITTPAVPTSSGAQTAATVQSGPVWTVNVLGLAPRTP